MKKLIFFMVLVFCTIVANATTYRVKYDVNNQSYTSFIVRVESNRLTIGSNAYLLRRMGTITSSGLTFDSYAYGSSENGMFCVSTSSITVEKDLFTKLTGYIVIIDKKAYLAEKINEAKKFAGKDELYIYLSPADSARIHALSARTYFPLQVAKESFMGGIKAMIPSKNILIDYSFLETFQTLRKDFNFDFDGGPKHE